MSALALEVPASVRASWAAEIEADRAAQAVRDQKALRDAQRAEEAPILLAAATKKYTALRAQVEEAFDTLDALLPECAQARVEYEAAFATALKFDVVNGVRIAPLQRGDSISLVLNLGARS